MKNDKSSLILIVLITVLLGGGLFAMDSRMTRANNITINVTVTPDARVYSQPSSLQNVSAALPSFSDFLSSGQKVAQAQALRTPLSSIERKAQQIQDHLTMHLASDYTVAVVDSGKYVLNAAGWFNCTDIKSFDEYASASQDDKDWWQALPNDVRQKTIDICKG